MDMIDARGRSCPEPVIMTQKAVKQADHVVVLVDNQVSVDNITRFCSNKGYSIETSPEGADFRLEIRKK